MNLKSTTKQNCFLVGAGELPSYMIPVSEGDYLIAVDGGYDYCRKWNLLPDLVLGDFDSVSSALKEEIAKMQEEMPDKTKVLPVMKDDTDMLAALRIALARGYRSFRIYGGMGGRTDHTIANIQCLQFLKNQGAEGYLISDREMLFLIRNESIKFEPKSFGIFSLFALQKQVTGVTIRGMKYPLNQAELTDDYPIGISNEFIGEEAEVTVEEGTLLAVMQLM
ncbi:MAG: thiamine diphosphokinase [Lachnospiraceae bacterium]|nr:thiamine diphosphokinase [Lachnospiraceae bacterium]